MRPAGHPSSSNRIARTVDAATGSKLEEDYRLEDEIRREVFASTDAKEGPRAFMEKRPPRFTGR
jgi:enoyl-CoA hydratase